MEKIFEWLFDEVTICGYRLKKGIFVFLSIFLFIVTMAMKPRSASEEAEYLMNNHINPIVQIFGTWVKESAVAEYKAGRVSYGIMKESMVLWTKKVSLQAPTNIAISKTEDEIKKLKKYISNKEQKHKEIIQFEEMILDWAELGIDFYNKHEYYIECRFENRRLLKEAELEMLEAEERFLEAAKFVKLKHSMITGEKF